ncbi:hypothetical protein N9818_01445 [Arcobacteraceae bacterium]|nr:hypothetical protein [Arcobacteraceae bacterium]
MERLNSNTITLNIQKYSIETVLANALDKIIIDDEDNNQVEIIDLFDSDVDINYISIAIKNLIDNALKYKESGKVKIIVEK